MWWSSQSVGPVGVVSRVDSSRAVAHVRVMHVASAVQEELTVPLTELRRVKELYERLAW